MPPLAERTGRSSDLRRAFERLDGLPVRPASARAVLELAADRPDDPEMPSRSANAPKFLGTDPGVAAGQAGGSLESLLKLVADRPWWRAPSPEAGEVIESLWKHAVAASGAARRLAAEAGRDDVEELARAALLHQLGLWAVAAVAPDRLSELLSARTRAERRLAERDLLGREATALGGDLAERWRLGPCVAAAAWLHADARGHLNPLADDPAGLALIQQAHAWAERTPWALCPAPPAPGPTDPRLRLLIAEVQVRCSGGLLDDGASIREEAVSRAHSGLLGRFAEERRSRESRDRFLRTIAEGGEDESPASWAERVAMAWCEEPGIASAKVVWLATPGASDERNAAEQEPSGRSAPRILSLGRGDRPAAELHLWPGPTNVEIVPIAEAVLPAWGAWADLIAERDRRVRRLDDVVSVHRSVVETEEQADRTGRLEALAEFAAGAGHELNNPLAVILGRAQLLIPLVADAGATRSLRIIIGQAQRAHRILRDLMYVARPPALRPRPCQPDEILRASIRDFRDEAEARGIRIISETRQPVPVAWADPDPLRHLADVLVRNALEATAAGGSVRISSGRIGDRLRWVVRDSGRGIAIDEGAHLFEPFYCGRQAGRGLGLGLPRAARFAAQVGGTIAWRSGPNQGAVFSVELPIEAPRLGIGTE